MKTLRAFVFDDDVLMRSMLWAALDRRGYEVFTFPAPALCPFDIDKTCGCGNGERCADIIISGLNMPGLTGLDFVERLKSKKCRCGHVALIAGTWTERDMLRAANLGCRLFAKPLHAADIHDWLDQLEETADTDKRKLGSSFLRGQKVL